MGTPFKLPKLKSFKDFVYEAASDGSDMPQHQHSDIPANVQWTPGEEVSDISKHVRKKYFDSPLPMPGQESPATRVSHHTDEWNKYMARRLENEYQRSKPHLEKLVEKLGGMTPSEAGKVDYDDDEDEDEEEPDGYTIEEWDPLPDNVKDEVFETWKKNSFDDFYNSEVEGWQDNNEEEAKQEVHGNWENGEHEWLDELLDEMQEEHGEDLPFEMDDIKKAIQLDNNYKGLKVTFDDDELQTPNANAAGWDSENQKMLPDAEVQEPHELFTDEHRKIFADAVKKAFDKAAEKHREDMEPPDWLSDSTDENLSSYWDETDDDQKLEHSGHKGKWYNNETDEIEDEPPIYNKDKSSSGDKVKIPGKYNPLGSEWHDGDYPATRQIANRLQIHRAYDLLKERGLLNDDHDEDTVKRHIGARLQALWSGWKSSSTGTHGSIIQAAAAEEMGSRMDYDRHQKRTSMSKSQIIDRSNIDNVKLGGFHGDKALLRATWETSQYLLDKAGIDELNVYRGINDPDSTNTETEEVTIPDNLFEDTYQKLPNANITRNGAASTSLSHKVSNEWGSSSGRVVLRIKAPRTAALSLPVYGQNVHNEHEVVLGGTAWHSWDAWAGTSPKHEDHPVELIGPPKPQPMDPLLSSEKDKFTNQKAGWAHEPQQKNHPSKEEWKAAGENLDAKHKAAQQAAWAAAENPEALATQKAKADAAKAKAVPADPHAAEAKGEAEKVAGPPHPGTFADYYQSQKTQLKSHDTLKQEYQVAVDAHKYHEEKLDLQQKTQKMLDAHSNHQKALKAIAAHPVASKIAATLNPDQHAKLVHAIKTYPDTHIQDHATDALIQSQKKDPEHQIPPHPGHFHEYIVKHKDTDWNEIKASYNKALNAHIEAKNQKDPNTMTESTNKHHQKKTVLKRKTKKKSSKPYEIDIYGHELDNGMPHWLSPEGQAHGKSAKVRAKYQAHRDQKQPFGAKMTLKKFINNRKSKT